MSIMRNTPIKRRPGWVAVLALGLLLVAPDVHAQTETYQTHERGRIWDVVWNDGHIGDPGAWDFLSFLPKGLFPGFSGFIHPCCREEAAVDVFANANMHNFRSGVWIAAKNVTVPGNPPDFAPTPRDYELYVSGEQGATYGVETVREPIELTRNFMENDGFDPLLPEETITARWHTNLGITVTRRSYAWGYPGYRDMILFDYIFENTGQVVSTLTGEVVPNTSAFSQTLEDVYFAFHSGISVSTKSQINFHSDLNAVQAGAFGWKEPYHDFYGVSTDGTLAYSYNYNGGASPPPFDTYPVKDGEHWKQFFGEELQSPAAFGWVGLYATNQAGGARSSARPDVFRIDVHKGGTFKGQDLDLQDFNVKIRTPKEHYEFVTTPDLQDAYGNTGNRFNFYTFSYGPYDLAPGQTVRIMIAEIAGVMDYHDVIAGDPDETFPAATIEAIEANAALARNAVKWGVGAEAQGIPIAADAPEPPPAPWTDAVNASQGTENAAIAVTWDTIAETMTFPDGSGSTFYDGLADLDGYRVYRTTDFQYSSDTEPPALRGAAWDLLVDIPKSEFGTWFDSELGKYSYTDEEVTFGGKYAYYVSAYDSDPGSWTSANGTVVANLGELASADIVTYGTGDDGRSSRTFPASAVAGPVESMDVYAVPNPYVFGDALRSFGLSDPYRIELRNLPERAQIRIYTISGDLVRTIQHGPDQRGNLSGTAIWDQKSDSGLLVAPGLYVFHVRSRTEGVGGELTGKIMIIR
jgi:hypothetical protein